MRRASSAPLTSPWDWSSSSTARTRVVGFGIPRLYCGCRADIALDRAYLARMTRTSFGLLLLLLASGCGKYAAAQELSRRHETVAAAAQHARQQQESDAHRDECKRTKRLFC